MQPGQIAGIAFLLVGALLLQHFGRALYRGRASTQWRKTDGYIVGRGAYAGSLVDGSGAAAVPTYTYSVHGVEYTSNRYDIAGNRTASDPSGAFADHSVGQRVTVWYDPADPGRAVLVPGMQNSTYQRMLLGTAFLLTGVSFLLASRAELKNEQATTRAIGSVQVDSTRFSTSARK